MSSLEELRSQAANDPEIPEGVRNFLAKGAALDDIRLDPYGRWFHQGEPFINVKLANLFHQSLYRTASGTWFLQISPYTYPVSVELTDRFVNKLLDDSSSPKAKMIGKPDETPTISLENLYTDGGEIIATTVDGKPTRIVETAYRDLLEKMDEVNGDYIIQFSDRIVKLLPLPENFFAEAGRVAIES